MPLVGWPAVSRVAVRLCRFTGEEGQRRRRIIKAREPLHRDPIDGLHTDAITLVAEVIESKVKPSQPWGRDRTIRIRQEDGHRRSRPDLSIDPGDRAPGHRSPRPPSTPRNRDPRCQQRPLDREVRTMRPPSWYGVGIPAQLQCAGPQYDFTLRCQNRKPRGGWIPMLARNTNN